jgi:hypothetical protein
MGEWTLVKAKAAVISEAFRTAYFEKLFTNIRYSLLSD